VLLVDAFSFERCAELRDLHSFPTRRSSDLKPEEGKQSALAMLTPNESDMGDGTYFPYAETAPWWPKSVARTNGSEFTVHVVDSEDRKSTRLNSSHVKISYAVFCLKKKIDRR